ncbi:MAG: hypothetical protein JWP97_395 [Labilithrix sp.]|nr:hypothetical protein [Labilithrix sp.]
MSDQPPSDARVRVLPKLLQLCEEAAIPSPVRHAQAAVLLGQLAENPRLLGRVLEGARRDGAEAPDLAAGLRVVAAIDALSDRRPTTTIERVRAEDVVRAALADPAVETLWKALGLAARARIRVHHGEAENALADAERASALVEEAGGSPGARAFVASRHAYTLAMLARTEEAVVEDERSVAHARASGDREALVSALQDESNVLQQLGRSGEALARLEESLALAKEAGDAVGEMRALAGLAYRHLEAQRFEEARDAYGEALAIGETGVAPRLRALVMGYSAILHLEHDRVERALSLAARAVAESSKLGFRVGEGFFGAVQAAAHARAGDLVAAEDRVKFAKGRVPRGHGYVQVVAMFEAMVNLERGGARAESLARALLADVSTPRAGQERALVQRLDDARTAARILRTRLEVVGRASASQPAPPRHVRSVRPDGENDPLARRLDTRRLLSLLRGRPTRSVGAAELASHVWPDVTFPDLAAARARIDALLASAEGEALGGAVQRDGDAYVLQER